MKLTIEGQKVYEYGARTELAEGSLNFVNVEFDCSSEWDGYLITVQFIQKGKTINRYIGLDRACTIPPEVKAGWLMISCFGVKENSPDKATVIGYETEVNKSEIISTPCEPIPPTPDLYAQLVSKIEAGVKEVQKASQLIEEAKELIESRDQVDWNVSDENSSKFIKNRPMSADISSYSIPDESYDEPVIDDPEMFGIIFKLCDIDEIPSVEEFKDGRVVLGVISEQEGESVKGSIVVDEFMTDTDDEGNVVTFVFDDLPFVGLCQPLPIDEEGTQILEPGFYGMYESYEGILKLEYVELYKNIKTLSNIYLSPDIATVRLVEQVSEAVTNLNRYISTQFYTKSGVDFTFLKKTDANSTFLTQSSAYSTYLGKYDARQTYLSKDDAKTGYASKDDAKMMGLGALCIFGGSALQSLGITSGLFANSYASELPCCDMQGVTSMNAMYFNCRNLKVIKEPKFQSAPFSYNKFDTSNVSYWRQAFGLCQELETIEPILDFTSYVNSAYGSGIFKACYKLKNIKIAPNTIGTKFDIGSSGLLTDESIQSIIDGLSSVEETQLLTFHSDVEQKITEEQLSVIHSKNWELG